MQKHSLTQLLSHSLFRIPDYQRGYAWGDKQWNDFIQDVDALVEEDVRSHYTGTVVTFQGSQQETRYDLTRLPTADVVDGQQRLTTCSLYLSVILHKLIQAGEAGYAQMISTYLYSVDQCKLTLNNDTASLFHDLVSAGTPRTSPASTHQIRLVEAHSHFKRHLKNRCDAKGSGSTEYLKALYDAITRKLVFTYYTIEEESEIGMTFELMNSRGKDLSVLELLKNYLMHWVYRNTPESDRPGLTNLINKHWKDAYSNIGSTGGNGNEDQCLRVAWTLFCSHPPKNWEGYHGFKEEAYIPLRKFMESGSIRRTWQKTKEETQDYMIRFTEGLSLVSKHYARIVNPTTQGCISLEEEVWLTKIHHAGNIANFLPLMTAARIRREEEKITEDDYIALLKALECYVYRVFLFEGKRSNAGKSRFHRLADDLFKGPRSAKDVAAEVYGLTDVYSSPKFFNEWNSRPENWYVHRGLLRYTLYEYELHLLKTEGKGKAPALRWEQLMLDSSIEHVLPQNPSEGSEWLLKWNDEDRALYLHDLGNLVFTQNNSNYLNFDFPRKKGQPGESPSYSHSDIRQERGISAFADWTPKELIERRTKIVEWVLDRWKSGEAMATTPDSDTDDDDGTNNVN